MARIEDRWVRGDKTRTPRYGQGLRYRAEGTPPGETKKRKSFATKKAAEAFLADQVSDINRGTYVTSRKKILLRDYAEKWQQDQLHQRDSSREQITARFRINIIPSLGGKPLDVVERADVQAAVGEWSKTLAPSTVRVAYSYLATMYKAAVLDGHVWSTPCVSSKLPKVEDVPVVPLKAAVVQAISERIFTSHRPMVVFAAATGLRSSELRGLTWDRLDLQGGMVTVDRQIIGNNSRVPRWGPHRPGGRSISARRPWACSVTCTSFRTGRRYRLPLGRPVHHEGHGGGGLADVKTKVPGAGTGWHELRHFHASQLIAGGMSPVAVAHRLGHKDATETLKTYAHLWPDDDTRAAAITDGVVTLIAPEKPPAAEAA